MRSYHRCARALLLGKALLAHNHSFSRFSRFCRVSSYELPSGTISGTISGPLIVPIIISTCHTYYMAPGYGRLT